jgi:nucleotide-binding universal stress UspA family protein
MYKRILIATDGSERSRRAVEKGVGLAKATGAAIVGFHARSPGPQIHYGEVAVMLPREVETAFEKETVAQADKYLGEIETLAKQAGVDFKGVHYSSASPADAILETAGNEQCDLIVMASHGRRGLSLILLGSETMKVLTHFKGSVLVTH